MDNRPKFSNKKNGFTLVESLIAVLVLTILMVGVFSAINRAQGHYRVENQKVDITQQQREFLDQFTRDLHQAGFPTPASQGLPPPAGGFNGLTKFTSTDLVMTGDLDGVSGVQTVEYVYLDSTDPNCPNCLQRIVNGVASAGVNNVVAPNAQEIFTGYDNAGNTTTTLNAIRSVRIMFTVQGGTEVNRSQIQTTMTGMARLPNND